MQGLRIGGSLTPDGILMYLSLHDYLTQYCRGRLDLAPTSIEQLRISLGRFGEWLGRPPTVADLSRENLLAWMRWLAESRAPSTVNSKRQAILALWNAAAEEGLCPPPGRIAKLKEPRRLPVAWTVQEVERIFQAVARLRGCWAGVPISVCWQLGLLVLWDTGGRLGLLLAAKTSHVDLTARSLFVPAENLKGRRGDRLFLLHEQTIQTVAASLAYGNRTMLWPFPWGRRQVWPHLKRILRSAGLPDDRQRMFHCIRRTAESYAAAARGIEWAASAIGHNVEVARKSYVSPQICRPPALIEALPRPRLT